MKQRFSAMDVSAEVADLKGKLVGLRLQNVYDINPRTYLLKFSRAEQKELVLVESGIRVHTTAFVRDKSHTPSPFAMKLRKHLRTRRLTGLDQLGTDRVVDFRFGEGENTYHLFIEMYDKGNIVLCDAELKILSVLRRVEEGGWVVGSIYNVTTANASEEMSVDKMRKVLQGKDSDCEPATGDLEETELPDDALSKKVKKTFAKKQHGNQKAKTGKDKKKAKAATLRRVLRERLGKDYGPALVEHCLLASGVDPNINPDETDLAEDSAAVEALVQAFRMGDALILSCRNEPQKGWIVLENLDANGVAAHAKADDSEMDFVSYAEFHPVLFNQFKTSLTQEYGSFDKAVDEFFSKHESQKLALKARHAEIAAHKKLESVKASHLNQVRGLEAQQEESARVASAIELSLETVDSLIGTLRAFIASGMDWKELEEIINEEKKRGNPVARIVGKLKLDVGMVGIILPDPTVEDESSDDEADETESEAESDDEMLTSKQKQKMRGDSQKRSNVVLADIDIYSSAHANASRYYGNVKTARTNQSKTELAVHKALKTAEQKIAKELASTQKEVPSIQKIRKPFWFERFLWFISSENYLIVGGRDAAQNEMLVRRYLNKGDVYVHADLHGAPSVIVKNLPASSGAPEVPPPTTLHQAAYLSVCNSRAWEAKVVTSAYWVHADQVSKTAPTGEYLTTGSFMVRGKKNWLPPVQLQLGIGVIFKVDDDAIARHWWERRPWARGEGHSLQTGVADVNQTDERSDELETPDISDPQGSEELDTNNLAGAGDVASSEPPTVDHSTQDSRKEQFKEGLVGPPVVAERADDKVDEDRYGLVELNAAEEDEDLPESPAPQQRERKHRSAKERRDLRKARAGNNDTESVDSTSPAASRPGSGNSGKKTKSKTDGQNPPGVPQKQQPQVRGKKGKLKKMNNKYRDWDEEDREGILSLLGGKKIQEADKAELVAEQEAAVSAHNDEKDHQKGAKQSKEEKREISAMLQEENITILPSDLDTSFLDTLTGEPHPHDILHFALPMCAPWDALRRYKYKVKLTPGSGKRGKIAKEVLNAWVAESHSAERESVSRGRERDTKDEKNAAVSEETKNEIDAIMRQRELIKGIPDTEMINAVLGKSKVAGAEAKKGSKGGKRK
ncbi:hypothetical protein BC832DRAFT_619601 [Gaertneriomyces semiglobifer]|nr:hypothetical protein BC832DRAFT_619601 [Gaertneriomyces semiglobifer]